ncbi:MAG: glycosyltransferase family 1 protein [Azospirillaceae bacterium]
MRILIVSDAWYPQVNGVVRALDTTARHARDAGHEVEVIGPDRFRTVATPGYAEIRLSVLPRRKLVREIEAAAPDAIHIATEGPLGWAARGYCRRHRMPFTTSFHTQFPEYVWLRTRIPLSWSYGLIRTFHNAADHTMVTTETLRRRLGEHGIARTVIWPRGVDTAFFRPLESDLLADLPRPVMAYVGRVAVEKNLEAFLSLDRPGTKLIVGDGPSRRDLERRYPDAVFVGARTGDDLVRHYSAADVFAFPSRTDTFGLVLLEALACGVPVAAYPVQGPQDVVGGTDVACLDEDLGRAIDGALAIPRERCRAFALERSWVAATAGFVEHLTPIDPAAARWPAPAAA